VSAFDDEFGLFGDDQAPEEERRPTLGARKIATNETVIDEIEFEDERPGRRRGPASSGGGPRRDRGGDRRPAPDRGPRTTADPAVAQSRAVDLLGYLARKLVSKPDEVIVEVVEGARGPVIELEVHPDDFGKVIGKGGRVAQALRTLVRAAAEGRVTIDIVDVEHDADLEHAGDGGPVAVVEVAEIALETAEPVVEAAAGDEAPAKAPARKRAAPRAAGAKKKGAGTAAKATRKR
jgi:predicted RNA-binding protein YlqC (UPF0109 family)